MSEFTVWLKREITKKGLLQADLAKLSGLDPGYISQILIEKRRPGPVAARAIAHALNIPEVTFFTKVGHLSQRPERDLDCDMLIHILMQLPHDDRQELIDIANIKLIRYKSKSAG